MALLALAVTATPVRANPYLAKPGEAPFAVYSSTCAVTGSLMHIYTALDHPN